MELWVDPAAARARGVSVDELSQALVGRNVSGTGGKLRGAPSQRQVVLSGEWEEPAEIEETILRMASSGGRQAAS